MVWVLNKMGIRTSQSCEGHPDREVGNPKPNIELSEEMATKLIVLMDGWDGIETGDVIFSRMLTDGQGAKDLVDMDFMNASLVEGFVKFLTHGS